MTNGLSHEANLVRLLALPELHEREVLAVRELLDAQLDWNQVLGMIALHRVAGTAWRNIERYAIQDRKNLKSAYFIKSLRTTAVAQSITAAEQLSRTVHLQGSLDRRGIRSVILKGAAVASMAYDELGLRAFSDNDVLVERARLQEAGEVLTNEGYVQGSWDYASGTVRPAPRAEALFMVMHSHQTYSYMKPTPEAQFLECHRVDLHFSIDLMTNRRSDNAVQALLGDSIVLRGLRTVTPLDMLIFSCLHFAREARHIDDVRALKDLVLYKLIDVVALIKIVPANSIFPRAEILGFEREVCFTLWYADMLYPGRIPDNVIDRAVASDLTVLDEVENVRGDVIHRWRIPLPQRMFDLHRLQEIPPS